MDIFRSFGFAACLIIATCAPPRQPSVRENRITAASQFTRRCATSRLAKWNIRGAAAGADCGILLVETTMVLDDSLTEAIHYGTGAYVVVDGGVRRFTRECEFRGVAYRDRTGRVRTFGDLPQGEAEDLQPCH